MGTTETMSTWPTEEERTAPWRAERRAVAATGAVGEVTGRGRRGRVEYRMALPGTTLVGLVAGDVTGALRRVERATRR